MFKLGSATALGLAGCVRGSGRDALHELDRAIGRRVTSEGGLIEDPRREVTIYARCTSASAAAAGVDGASARNAFGQGTEESGLSQAESARRVAAQRAALSACATVAALARAHPDSCWLVDDDGSCGGDSATGATEINALCFRCGEPPCNVLLLTPAAAKVDLRWLALLLNCARRRLRFATDDECIEAFGAVPGRVPPLPLRVGVRVLCDPRLRDASELWGSSCDPKLRLHICKPRFTLPAIMAAATAAAAATVPGAPAPPPAAAAAAALAAAAIANVTGSASRGCRLRGCRLRRCRRSSAFEWPLPRAVVADAG